MKIVIKLKKYCLEGICSSNIRIIINLKHYCLDRESFYFFRYYQDKAKCLVKYLDRLSFSNDENEGLTNSHEIDRLSYIQKGSALRRIFILIIRTIYKLSSSNISILNPQYAMSRKLYEKLSADLYILRSLKSNNLHDPTY